MRKRLVSAILLIGPVVCLAAELKPVALPAPRTSGGKPLMEALNARKSTREFDSARLSPEVLSNLLWAATGVNRADGRRTAPTAMNRQEVDVYVIMADGAFLYVPNGHKLQPVDPADVRALAGTQAYVKEAPLNLVYVADLAKAGPDAEKGGLVFSGAAAGFISQNVYLFCASEGLVTVVRASIDKAALGKALHLRPDQRILLAQSVGNPKKK